MEIVKYKQTTKINRCLFIQIIIVTLTKKLFRMISEVFCSSFENVIEQKHMHIYIAEPEDERYTYRITGCKPEPWASINGIAGLSGTNASP